MFHTAQLTVKVKLKQWNDVFRCGSAATPRLYQEIRERGLHSTNQDELLDDFVVVEAPVEDQGIVVKSYRPAQLTWSQLPQVNPSLLWRTIR